MQFEKELFEFITESKSFQGEMRAMVGNINDHISSVSQKANTIRDELNVHKDSQDAHGAKAAGKSLSGLASWVGIAISVCTLMTVVYKLGLGR